MVFFRKNGKSVDVYTKEEIDELLKKKVDNFSNEEIRGEKVFRNNTFFRNSSSWFYSGYVSFENQVQLKGKLDMEGDITIPSKAKTTLKAPIDTEFSIVNKGYVDTKILPYIQKIEQLENEIKLLKSK
ncbi:MAG: hypothetical protein ACRCUM_02775 [Mycoplasmoidaceae bacterium]